MKVTKSDVYFSVIFIGIAANTVLGGLAFWPAGNRFPNLWFSIGYVVFLEAILFLKPVAISQIRERGGAFWAVLFSFDIVYSIVGAVILILSGILSKGAGVLTPITVIGWTLVFLFFAGLFAKTAKTEAQEESRDKVGRGNKQKLRYQLSEALEAVKIFCSTNEAAASKLLPEAAIVEKLVANMEAGRGGESTLESEIKTLIDALQALAKTAGEEEVGQCLAQIKLKLRQHESMRLIQ